MRKVVLGMQVSLDGFVARPDGDLSWMWPGFDEALRRSVIATLATIDTHLMGRVNYEGQVAQWPHAADEIAVLMNNAEKIVFSGSLARVDWRHARLANADPATEIARLKQLPGRSIAVSGGARFAASLVRQSLIDEYDLIVHPVVLGAGLRLFDRIAGPLALAPVDVERFATGVVRLRYRSLGASGVEAEGD